MYWEKYKGLCYCRYIPDDETFDYELKSVATSLPASGTYKPPHFVNAAVSRTDVSLFL